MTHSVKKTWTITAIAFGFCLFSAHDARACGKKPWDLAITTLAAAPVQDAQALAGRVESHGDNVRGQIVGMWIVTFYVDGKQWDFGIEQFHADGTEMTNDIYAPAVGNVCWGIWEPTSGSNAFRMKHTGVTFDSSGTYTGLFDLSASLLLSSDGDTFTGKFVADQEDVGGNILPAFHAEGVLKAKRFKFDHPGQ